MMQMEERDLRRRHAASAPLVYPVDFQPSNILSPVTATAKYALQNMPFKICLAKRVLDI
jgi:hypothetical protein